MFVAFFLFYYFSTLKFGHILYANKTQQKEDAIEQQELLLQKSIKSFYGMPTPLNTFYLNIIMMYGMKPFIECTILCIIKCQSIQQLSKDV